MCKYIVFIDKPYLCVNKRILFMRPVNIDKPYFNYVVEVINTLKNLINSNIFAFFVVA